MKILCVFGLGKKRKDKDKRNFRESVFQHYLQTSSYEFVNFLDVKRNEMEEVRQERESISLKEEAESKKTHSTAVHLMACIQVTDHKLKKGKR